MYCFESRIRYSEIDSAGKLSLESMINYFQDCSTFHSESLGLGPTDMNSSSKVWVLSAWQVQIDRYPIMGESIQVCTAPYEFKGFSGKRNFWLLDNQGIKIALANSIWTLIDRTTKMPTRITAELIEKFKIEEKLEMKYEPRKIVLPVDQGDKGDAIIIKHHHLDTNNHVNNGQYIAIALDSIEGDIQGNRLRVEYKKSAMIGDEITPYVIKSDKGNLITLCDKEDNAYAVIEILRL